MSISTYLPPAPLATTTIAGADELSLRGALNMVQRRRQIMLSVFCVVALLAAMAPLLKAPVYEATALIMINPVQGPVADPSQAARAPTRGADLVDSGIEVLHSRELTERLAEHLNLGADPAWSPIPDGADRARVSDSLITKVQNAISIRRRGDTNVVEIVASSPNATQSARMANDLVELYVGSQVAFSLESSAQATSWLNQRLTELRAELLLKEQAAQLYRAQNGLLESGGVSLTEQQISSVQGSVLAARADYAEKQARYQQVQAMIQGGGGAASVNGALNSEVIRELRAREADIAQRQTDMESRYSDQHPALQNVRAERASIGQQINAEVGRILSNLRSEMEVSYARLASLETSLGAARGQLQANNTAQVPLNELEREAAAARTVYESYLQRLHEVSQQGALARGEVRAISAARPPSAPATLNPSAILVIALCIGAIAALLAALLAEHFDTSLRSAEDVEQKVGVPTIASIPTISRRLLGKLPLKDRHPAGYMVANPMSAFAEAFRVLRSSLTYSRAQAGRSRVVAITSALPHEGKTTTALCLARTIALSGDSVVLVDCDVRRRSLNEILNIAPPAGIMQVLDGKVHWRSVVGRDGPSNDDILPLAADAFTPVDVFGSERMRRLVDELTLAYDMVLFDCAPILIVAETRALVSLADTVIVVGRWAKTSADALAAAIAQIESTGTAVTGIALNQVNPRAPGQSSYSRAIYYSDVQKNYFAQQ